jgi:cytoskeletal protein RodZ|tara:strand:+ start:316 stop:522 length:207 start_codon:yes stop_codon:yes gene_type:complete
MTTQLKVNNSSKEFRQDQAKIKKPRIARPNIDHLIKRILVERKKKNKKNLLEFVLILLVVLGITAFFI